MSNLKLNIDTALLKQAVTPVAHLPKPNHSDYAARCLFFRTRGGHLEVFADNTNTSGTFTIDKHLFETEQYADVCLGFAPGVLVSLLKTNLGGQCTVTIGETAVNGSTSPIAGLTLQTPYGKYEVASEANGFPSMNLFGSNAETKHAFSADLDAMQVVLNNGNKIAANDELKPAMSGIHFASVNGFLQAIATDGNSLYRHESKTIETQFDFNGVIVPIDATQQFQRCIQAIEKAAKAGSGYTDELNLSRVRVSFTYTDESSSTPTYSVFECGPLKFQTRNTDARYPDWQNVWPTEFAASAFANYKELHRRLKLAQVYGQAWDTRWDIESGYFKLFTEHSDDGHRAVQRVKLETADGIHQNDLCLNMHKSNGLTPAVWQNSIETLNCNRVQLLFPRNPNIEGMVLLCNADNVNELQGSEWDIQQGVICLPNFAEPPTDELRKLMTQMERRMDGVPVVEHEPVTV